MILRASEDDDLRKRVDAGLQVAVTGPLLVLFIIIRLRAVPLRYAMNWFIPLLLTGIYSLGLFSLPPFSSDASPEAYCVCRTSISIVFSSQDVI